MSDEKKALRKEILKIRDGLAYEQRDNDSAMICDMLFFDPMVLGAKNILLFASFGSEPDTDVIADRALNMGKSLYYPLVCDNEIYFYGADDISDLKPGYKGIREPGPIRPWEGDTDDSVVIVPGTAFDRRGYRIGYGGGFYDRFLKRFPKLRSIGICFPFQLLDSVPAEEYDEKVDHIVCGII